MLTDPSRALPTYLRSGCDALASRARRAVATLADCRAWPRDCGVNRLEDRWAACKTGRYAVVSSFFPHFGEEDCLRGWNGSGTIFFVHCNLRCVFCQNFDISQDIKPPSQRGSTPHEIATMMLWLQAQGCHNINFVTPEHVAPRSSTMPVYEFACRDCQKTFEIVRPMSESSSANVTCTHCGSTKVERIWSTVYTVTSKKS